MKLMHLLVPHGHRFHKFGRWSFPSYDTQLRTELLLPTTKLTALIKLSKLSFIMEINFSYVCVTTRNWFCLATNRIDTRDEACIIAALNETNETTSLKY
jgi:hypothetical protein